MTQGPVPPSSRGMVERALDLVTGVQTWKRAFILVLFAVVSLVGVMLYQHPQWVEHALDRHDTQPLLVDALTIGQALPALRLAVGADLLVVFATEVRKNEQWMVGYDATHDIREIVERDRKDLWGYTRPFLSEESPWNPIVIELLNGNSGCYPMGEGFVRLAIPELLVVVCVVGVPPGPEALVGWIAAGFARPLDRPQTAQVRAILRSQAARWVQ